MKESDSELNFKIFKKTKAQENDKKRECVEYFTNNRDEINSLLFLAGVNYHHNGENHGDDFCDCSQEKQEEQLVYDLEEFRKDLISTFDSTNFENSLDVFKNFKLKLMNKGFSPEASERIILNILCDYMNKKSLIIETKDFFNLIGRKELNDRPILKISVEKSDYPEERTVEKIEMISMKNNIMEDNIENILKLAGIKREDVVFKDEKKEDKKEKKFYILDIEIEKKDQKKEEDNATGCFLRVVAKNRDEMEKIVDLLCDHLQKIKNKGLKDVKFEEIDSHDRSKLEENEILIDRSPYMIKDRRIRAESDLDSLNTRILKQRFTKYGDNPLIYEIYKTLLSGEFSS